jgi:hypothetical protein
MTRRLAVFSLSLVALAAICVGQSAKLADALEPLIRPGVTAELDKGCGGEYLADERYALSVTVEREAYLTVFLFLPDGRTLLEFPFAGVTERRPSALEPGIEYEVPTDWLIEGPGRFLVPRPVGECAIVAVASEERLAIPHSTTRCEDRGVSQWLIAFSPDEAVAVILEALGGLPEGTWWAGAACAFTFVALEPVEGEEELPPGFFRCP